MQKVVWYSKAEKMYMEISHDEHGQCTICGLTGSRPHAHPAYELSMWFPSLTPTVLATE